MININKDNFKVIKENLYKCDFYKSILEIQNLEKVSETKEEKDEVLFFYYFYYVLFDLIKSNNKKEDYFQILTKSYSKAEIYFKFFELLNLDFWTSPPIIMV